MNRVMLKNGLAVAVEIPEGAERSVKGALHLHPKRARDVTDDELAALQADKDVSERLFVLPKHDPPKPAPKVKKVKAKAKDPTTEAKPKSEAKEKAKHKGEAKKDADKDANKDG